MSRARTCGRSSQAKSRVHITGGSDVLKKKGDELLKPALIGDGEAERSGTGEGTSTSGEEGLLVKIEMKFTSWGKNRRLSKPARIRLMSVSQARPPIQAGPNSANAIKAGVNFR